MYYCLTAVMYVFLFVLSVFLVLINVSDFSIYLNYELCIMNYAL